MLESAQRAMVLRFVALRLLWAHNQRKERSAKAAGNRADLLRNAQQLCPTGTVGAGRPAPWMLGDDSAG